MNCSKKAHALTRLAAALAALALALAPGASRAVNVWDDWEMGKTVVTVNWSTGETKNLSAWKVLDCAAYGPDHLLSALIGYRDPWANLDRFVARLEATCTSFDQKTTHAMTLSTSDHRDQRYRLDVLQHPNYICPAYYNNGPFGGRGMVGELLIGTDPAVDYAQNFNFLARCVKRRPEDGVLFWQTDVGYETYLINDIDYIRFGNPGRLRCPGDDHVATGIGLRYDTKKGKIREMKMLCRQLILKPS